MVIYTKLLTVPSIFHIFIFLSVLFLNFIDPVDSIEGAVSMNRILTGLMIVQTIFCLIGSIGFKNHITIENDLELLKKYNISFLNSDVIRAKTRILSAIVFPKLYLIFAILILSNVFQVNGYLSFLYFLSAIQVIIIKKTLELWRVKEANNMNSKNAIINFISMTLIMVSIVCFIVIYRNDYETYLIGQTFLIGVTIINYLFHLIINKDREAEVVSC